MAEIPRPGTAAGGYCMDAVEVTKYQYDLFIKAAAATLNEQIPECRTANTSFYPRHAWPPIPGPPSGNGITADTALGFNYSLPVHYVDWCDAYAYCKWAGKQLCGGVNGGKADFAKPNQADSSAWYNACSAGGNSDWPYSTQFSSGKCNGGQGLSITLDQCGPLPQRSGYGCPEETQDLGVHYVVDGNKSGTFSNIMFSECAGGHTGVYHLSGNVAEWEDSCNGTESTSLCRVRGGSFLANNNPTAMSCKSGQTLSRVPLATGNPNTDVTRDLGIRCCSF